MAEILSPEKIQQIKRMLAGGHGPRAIGRKLGISHTVVIKYRDKREDTPSEAAAPIPIREQTETNDVSGDNWTISLPKTRIHTLDQLIEHCQVDLNIWEVERFVCNKWEVGAADKKDGTLIGIKVEPLFQVKVWLRRKRFDSVQGYIEENTKLRVKVEKLQQKVRVEAEMAKRLAANHAGFDELLADVREFGKAFGNCSIPTSKIQTRRANRSPLISTDHSEDAVLLISDTHYGERIRREDTSGFQEVNLVVQGNRTGAIAHDAKEVLTLHRQMYPIDTLHVWFGGDIGNGELHSAAVSNSINVIEQIHFSVNMLRFLLRDLLTLTEPDPETGVVVVQNINLLFTVGNHMRVDEKMPYKLQARRTFDWLIYQVLIDEFRNTPHVTINTDLAPFIFQNIRGYRYMFCHGFQVGYKNKPDAQAKSVSAFMTMARALFDSRQWREENGLTGETFSRACIGDIHVPLSFPRFVSNASLSGQNELGANWMLEPIPAGMQLFGVSDKRMQTWSYFLDVTHVGSENPNAYAQFAKRYLEAHNA